MQARGQSMLVLSAAGTANRSHATRGWACMRARLPTRSKHNPHQTCHPWSLYLACLLAFCALPRARTSRPCATPWSVARAKGSSRCACGICRSATRTARCSPSSCASPARHSRYGGAGLANASRSVPTRVLPCGRRALPGAGHGRMLMMLLVIRVLWRCGVTCAGPRPQRH